MRALVSMFAKRSFILHPWCMPSGDHECLSRFSHEGRHRRQNRVSSPHGAWLYLRRSFRLQLVRRLPREAMTLEGLLADGLALS